MKHAVRHSLPPERRAELTHAVRLEWWTIAWMVSVIGVMGLVMGSSQAMRTAWIEDMLSLVPPAVFLISRRFEARAPTARFPFGFQRANSLAFLVASVALAALGVLLLFDAIKTLVLGERVTIGLLRVFGYELWAGWLMIGALVYSVAPPVILGHRKQPLAKSLQDKVLHTDAMMNKADWMTGLTGIGGVIGLGLGLWWADAVAAGLISFSVLKDGLGAMRTAAAELVDGAPRALEGDGIAHDAQQLGHELSARFPHATIRMRETGRYIRVVVDGASAPPDTSISAYWPAGLDRPWRLAAITFHPRTDEGDRGEQQGD